MSARGGSHDLRPSGEAGLARAGWTRRFVAGPPRLQEAVELDEALGYEAVVNRGRVAPGDRVLVLGCGGIGLNLVQVAAALGARVVAVDRSGTKLEWARRLVLVGYSPDAMSLNSGRARYREMEVVGSLGCRPVDYPRVIDLVRRGRIRVAELASHRFPLSEISAAFDLLRSGGAIRAIVVP